MVVWRLCAVGCGTERDSANLHLSSQPARVCSCVPVLEHRRADAPPSATGPRRGRTSGRPGVCCSRSGMDQGSAAGTGGTFISLSDSEQRCYSGLYALCQPDSTGKPAAGKVAELFRASQLPAETLHQVSLRGFHRRP